MKIVCYKDNILKALNSVIKGVATKTTMPILEGILIQTNDNEIKLTTYDQEIGIEYILECDVIEQGSTVVNAVMFSEIIRKLPDTEISITLNKNNLLEIECEGALYKLTTMNPDEFPELPKIEIENSIEVDQNVLKNMIRKTIFAVSNEIFKIGTENALFRMFKTGEVYVDCQSFGVNGYNGFTGTVEYSDGTYENYVGGLLIGGKSKEGAYP